MSPFPTPTTPLPNPATQLEGRIFALLFCVLTSPRSSGVGTLQFKPVAVDVNDPRTLIVAITSPEFTVAGKAALQLEKFADLCESSRSSFCPFAFRIPKQPRNSIGAWLVQPHAYLDRCDIAAARRMRDFGARRVAGRDFGCAPL